MAHSETFTTISFHSRGSHPEHCLADLRAPRITHLCIPPEFFFRFRHDIIVTTLLKILLILSFSHRESFILTAWRVSLWKIFLSKSLKLLFGFVSKLVVIIAKRSVPRRHEEITKIAAAAFAESVGVVCGSCIGYTDWGTDICIAYFVSL